MSWEKWGLRTLLTLFILLILPWAGEGATQGANQDSYEWQVLPEVSIRDIGFSDMAAGNGIYVMVGEDMNLRISKDGKQWEARQLGGTGSLQVVAWGDAGFVIVGQAGFRIDEMIVFTSKDGKQWEELRKEDVNNSDYWPSYHSCVDLVGHEGYYFLLNRNEIYRSEDGQVWELLSDEIYGNKLIAAAGEMFVIGNYVDKLFRSSDLGETWEEIDVEGEWLEKGHGSYYSSIRDVVWDGQRFLAVAGNRILSSSNGSYWNVVDIDNSDLHTWDSFSSLAYGNGIYVLKGGNIHLPRNITGYSSDGLQWHFIIEEPGNLKARQLLFDGSKFIGYGNRYYTGTSTNGADWEIDRLHLAGSLRLVYNGSTFVAYGEDGNIVTSDDGKNWIKRESGLNTYIDGGIWDGNQFVLTSESTLLTSEDGSNWQSRKLDENIFKILGWDGETYYFMGPFHSTDRYLSENLEDFTLVETEHFFRHMHYGHDSYLAATTSDIYYSEDGENWEEVYSGGSAWIYSITSGKNGFVAVGGRETLLFSPDGRNWTYQESPLADEWIRQHTTMSINYRDVAWNGESYLAVGNVGRVIESADGQQWEVTETGRYGVNDHLSSVSGDAHRNIDLVSGSFLAFRGETLPVDPDPDYPDPDDPDDEDFYAWDSQETTNLFKPWTVRFSQAPDNNMVSSETIYVKCNDGNPVPVHYQFNETEIRVFPEEKYNPGKTYTLFIRDLKSQEGTPLSKNVKMNFTIKE